MKSINVELHPNKPWQYMKYLMGSCLLVTSASVAADPGQPAAEPSPAICKVTRPFTSDGNLTKYVALIPGPYSYSRGGSTSATSSVIVHSNATEIAGGISSPISKRKLGYYFNLSSTTAPTAGFTMPELSTTLPPIKIPLNATTKIYISFGADSSDKVCSYSYDIVNTNGVNIASNIQPYERKKN